MGPHWRYNPIKTKPILGLLGDPNGCNMFGVKKMKIIFLGPQKTLQNEGILFWLVVCFWVNATLKVNTINCVSGPSPRVPLLHHLLKLLKMDEEAMELEFEEIYKSILDIVQTSSWPSDSPFKNYHFVEGKPWENPVTCCDLGIVSRK